MTDLYGFKDKNGNSYPIVDQTARNTANAVTTLELCDQKQLAYTWCCACYGRQV